MARRISVVLDTNVAALLVVGRVDPNRIEQHERLQGQFTKSDYKQLVDLLDIATEAATIPHILTELSNILKPGRDVWRNEIRSSLLDFCTRSIELPALSAEAARSEHFRRLDLADCRLLAAAADGHVIVSVDGPLIESIQGMGLECIHFLDWSRPAKSRT